MPEDQNIEWKENWRDEYIKWICGFANAQGGRIYIGMNDEGKVIGLPNYERLMEDIPNKIVSVLGIMPEVNLLRQYELFYIEINVAPSSVPVNYRGEYYYRCGSTRQQLKGAALNDFLLRKTGTRWDAATVHNICVENLDGVSFDIFKREAKRSGRLSEEDIASSPSELLERLHLIENGLLTRAAALIFHPHPERFYPGCYVKIGRFRNGSDLVYQDEIQGSFMRLADEVVSTLYIKYFKSRISYDNEVRIERYPYPRSAVREIFFNALVHNNWSDNIPIQIRVDDDRLIISNSCVLPWGWSTDDLISFHASRPFNPLIASTFFRAGYIEAWGRGISFVHDTCREKGYPQPQFIIKGESISVIFPIDPTFIEKEEKITKNNKEHQYSKLELRLLEEIKKNPQITQTLLAEKAKVSRTHVQSCLKSLMEIGIITREGARKQGKWLIKKPSPVLNSQHPE